MLVLLLIIIIFLFDVGYDLRSIPFKNGGDDAI